MKNALRFSLSVAILMFGATHLSHASVTAPEIDGSMASSAVALLAGAMMVARGRRRSKQ